jgi:hypothetical protein
LRRALAVALVLGPLLTLGWAGPLATGLSEGKPTLGQWACLQPRQHTPDGREIPFSGTPYFLKYHPEYFQDRSSSVDHRLTAPGSRLTDPPEGPGSARWAPVLRATGAHCTLYVDSAASPQPNDTVCGNLTNEFDTVIWPTDTGVFGTPGYTNIDIFIYPIDGIGGVGGYYAGGNDLYADSDDLFWMDEILAHEFQHLIHNQKDADEELWVNEGCADLAIQLCYGFSNNTTSLGSHIGYFEANPDNDLTVFQNQLYDYGSAYAFLSYFHEHYGGNATIKALVADPANGIQGFDDRLAGTGKTFTSVFRDWTVANYLDNETVAAVYGYANLSIKVHAAPVAAYPASVNGTVKRWAADYAVFTADGADLDLWFNGSDGAPLEVWLGKVGIGAVPSSVERLALDSKNDGSITVPRLGIDYSEVVMVTSASSSGGSYSFTANAVDRTPPVTTLAVFPALPDTPDGWYTRAPSLSLTRSEQRAVTFFRWDDGNDTEYSRALTAPEGAHVFRFHSQDEAGNAEAEHAFAVRVDTTAPETELEVAPPDGRAGWYVNAPDIGLGSEDGAVILYRWPGQDETEYDGPFRAPEGYSSLSYHSVDRHGNVEANRSAEFRVDTVRPASAILTDPAEPDGGNGWFLRPPVIRLETEPGSGLYYSWDGGPSAPYLLPFQAAEGNHGLSWYAEDTAGNREENRSFWVRVDSIAPSCAAALSPEAPDGNNGYYRSNVTIALSADPDATAIFRWDSGDWHNYTGPLRAPEGQSTLYYFAVDGAGNRAQERSLELAVDTVPPVTALSLEPDAGGEWTAESPAVALSSEPRARTFWSIDDGEPEAYSGHVQLPAGRHSLRYYSVDEAGNGEARRSVGYALDLSDPAGALSAGNLTPLEGQNVSFDGSGSADADSGVREYRFIFGDGTESGWVKGALVVHAFGRAGLYTVSLTVRDAAGRESAPVSVTVNVSAPPPPRRPAPPGTTLLDGLRPFLPYLLLLLAAAAAWAGGAAAVRLWTRRRGPRGGGDIRRDRWGRRRPSQ